MGLYQKYRPKTLEEVKGNEAVISSLSKFLKDKEHCPHSFLLSGPTGCGKTTLGRIIAAELGCKGTDLKEIDTADFRGIDTIREIRQNSQYAAIEGSCRVWIVDECHQLTKDAQNALLKILEDTPQHVYFILCTTDLNGLLPTIKGRCQQFQVELLTTRQMYRLIHEIVVAEGEELDKEVVDQIIESGDGHPRDTINILEKVLSVDNEQRLEFAKFSQEQQAESIELCRILVSKECKWKDVKEILNNLKGQKEETIRRTVLGYCQAILLKGENDYVAWIIEQFLEPFYNTGYCGLVYACYTVARNGK